MSEHSEVRFGTWASLGSSLAVEALARSGVDFVGLDLQHGAFGFREAAQAIQLLDVLGVDSFVRLPADELPLAPHLLDYGATGIIVAGCDSARTAAEAVSLTRFQPVGTRSFGGKRFGIRPISPQEEKPATFLMIETLAGLTDVSEIASEPGIAGLFVGPADLALALGLELEDSQSNAEWISAVDSVLDACASAAVEAGMFAFEGGAEAAYWANRGFSRVVVGSDLGLIAMLSAQLDLARAKSRHGGDADS